MISKKLLLSFIFINMVLDSSLAMEMPKNQLTDQVRVFHSAQEMFDLGKKIFELTSAQKYDQAFNLIPQRYEIEYSPVSFSDVEYFMFNRNYGGALYHKNAAEKLILTPNDCVKQYLFAIKYLEDYLSEWGNFFSQIESVNERMAHNRVLFCITAGTLYARLGELHVPSNTITQQQEIKKALYFLKKSLTYFQKVDSTTQFLSSEDNRENEINIFSAYLKIYSNLITLSPYTESNNYLKDAKMLYRKFKEKRLLRDYGEVKKSLKISESMVELKRQMLLPNNSQKIQEIRGKNILNLCTNILEDAESILNSTDNSLAPKTEINQLFNHCMHLSTTRDDTATIQMLDKIEQTTAHLLSQSQEPAQLYNIYQQLEVFIGAEALQKSFKSILITKFLKAGKIKECLERLTILADLELKQKGKISPLSQLFLASIPCLLGDYSKWLVFEEELKRIQLNTELSKKKKKEEQHQQHVDNIRRLQLIAQKNKDKKTEQNQKNALKKEKKKPEIKINEPQSSTNTVYEPSSSLSRKEEKALKQLRHEKAERQRHEKANQETRNLTLHEELNSKEDKVEVPEKLPLIKDLFELTKTAKMVDDQIEEGTWQFTREELILYFTCLGCEEKEGGKHKKLSLSTAKASIIMKEGIVVTVLNDIEGALALLGGALTLPRWDKSFNNGTVPHYLREQILEARRKLVLLHKQKK